MDMTIDPPPDLAIEADVTSKTTLGAYYLIGVPEVWIYDQGDFKIYLLQDKDYIESESSRVFPELNIKEMIPKLVQQAFAEGTSQMLRKLRQTLAIG
jgi:Uma2 family endonuclease